MTATLNNLSVLYSDEQKLEKFDFIFNKMVSLISVNVLFEEKIKSNFFSNFDQELLHLPTVPTCKPFPKINFAL